MSKTKKERKKNREREDVIASQTSPEKPKKKRLRKFLEAIQQATLDDIKSGHGETELFFNAVEELGEYAAASTVEKGIKNKVLKESKKIESIDLIICAFSLFFADEGTFEELLDIGPRKLKKWEDRIKKKLESQGK